MRRRNAHAAILCMGLPAVRGEFGVIHRKTVTCCCFTSDGKYLLCCTKEGEFNVWDFKGRRHIVSWKNHQDKVESIDISPSYCVLGSQDKLCSIWETNSVSQHWDLVQSLEGHKDWVLDVAISSDGSLVGTASRDQSCRIWSRNSHFKCIHKLGTAERWDYEEEPSKDQFDGQCTWIGFISKNVVVAGDFNGNVGIWKIRSSSKESTKENLQFVKVKGLQCVHKGALAPNGKNAFLGAANGHMCWLDLGVRDSKGIRVQRWMEDKHKQRVHMVAVCPDSKHGVSAYERLRLWDFATGRTIKLVNFSNEVFGGGISPCGKYVCVGGKQARVLDLFGNRGWGNEVFRFSEGNILKETVGSKRPRRVGSESAIYRDSSPDRRGERGRIREADRDARDGYRGNRSGYRNRSRDYQHYGREPSSESDSQGGLGLTKNPADIGRSTRENNQRPLYESPSPPRRYGRRRDRESRRRGRYRDRSPSYRSRSRSDSRGRYSRR